MSCPFKPHIYINAAHERSTVGAVAVAANERRSVADNGRPFRRRQAIPKSMRARREIPQPNNIPTIRYGKFTWFVPTADR